MANSGESVDVKCSYKLQPQILGNYLLGLNKKKSLQTAVQLWEINGNNLILAMTMHNLAFFESEKLGVWKLNCQRWKVWDCEDQEVFNQSVRLVLKRGRKQIALEGQTPTKCNCSGRTEEGGCMRDKSWTDRWRAEEKKKKSLLFPPGNTRRREKLCSP